MIHRLQLKAVEWNVSLEDTRETPGSVLGFGVRDGLGVVLKITKVAGDESHSGEVLKAYGGDGAVRVYESETGAVLLERLEPGEDLVDLVKEGKDEQATKILVEVIRKLANHEAPAVCPTVGDWGCGFDRYLQSGDERIPREVVHKARELYRALVSSQRNTMLLHGDLQHYNVLFDNKRGWSAIDPKGVVGELEYELGALVRNPVELPEVFKDPAVIECRLKTLTSSLHLDYSRALHWSYAQAILSAVWGIEDGYTLSPTDPPLLVAHSLEEML